MMEIEGSPNFVMGSPKGEPGRTHLEVQRLGALPHRYLLSAREVSWAQFGHFYRIRHKEWKALIRRQDEAVAGTAEGTGTIPGHPVEKADLRFYSTFERELDPELSNCADCPASGKWYAAIFYCLWLTEKEGFDKEEWCYEIRQVDPDVYGWALKDDYLSRSGYRLPTAAEWSWAATGPDGRLCAVGPIEDLWNDKAHVSLPSQGVGSIGGMEADRSSFGLVDMAGNVAELTSTLTTLNGVNGWIVMGGSYLSGPANAIVTNGKTVTGWLPLQGVGFRCVRDVK